MFRTSLAILICVFLAASSAAVSPADNPDLSGHINETIEIHDGQDIRLGDTILSYTTTDGSYDRLSLTDRQGRILQQYSGDEFYDMFGQTLELTGSIYVRPLRPVYSDGDAHLVLRAWATEDIFGTSHLNITAPQYIVEPAGTTFTLPLVVTNEGGIKETYDLQAETPEGVTVDFIHDGYNVSRIVLEPDTSKAVDASVGLDEDIGSGLHEIAFTIADRSKTTERFSFRTVNTTEEERLLRLSLDQNYIETGNGDTISIVGRIENYGDSVVDDIEPTVETPDGWNMTLDPSDIDTIEDGAFIDVEAEVTVPTTATTGDYFIDLGLAETDDIEDRTVRVNVTDSGSFGLVGIILAVLAIGFVAVVYRVFGRR